MPAQDGSSLFDLAGILAVFLLVAGNGFFVASEFALVSVRRSRVAELLAEGRKNANELLRSIDRLDEYLAATQLGITLFSLALGWVGEPALAHLIEPALVSLLGGFAWHGSHVIATVIAFMVITVLHIVLGELAPKSLAIQRSEATALAVIRVLHVFLILLRPAIYVLNGLGNLVLRACGLQAGTGESSFHSTAELKLLVAESHEAGLLHEAQHDLVERVFNLGDRMVSTIMTPRVDVDWIDIDDTEAEIIKTLRESRHDQLVVGKGMIDELVGMVLKKDLLDQLLQGGRLDIQQALKQPVTVLENTSVVRVLEQFKRSPVRLAVVIDEYGTPEGIITQTDLLEAIAGELPTSYGDEPYIVNRDDGSVLVEGMLGIHDAFEYFGFGEVPDDVEFNTFAGFALDRLTHLPAEGEAFTYGGWRFEIVDMDRRRIDKIMASRIDGDNEDKAA